MALNTILSPNGYSLYCNSLNASNEIDTVNMHVSGTLDINNLSTNNLTVVNNANIGNTLNVSNVINATNSINTAGVLTCARLLSTDVINANNIGCNGLTSLTTITGNDISCANLGSTTTINANNINCANLYATTTLNTGGSISCASLLSTGNVQGNNLISANNITGSGTLTIPNVTSSGTINANAINASGAFSGFNMSLSFQDAMGIRSGASPQGIGNSSTGYTIYSIPGLTMYQRGGINYTGTSSTFSVANPGIYLVSASIYFQMNNNGFRRIAIATGSGTNVFYGATECNAETAGVGTNLTCTTVVSCAPNDTVSVLIMQNSGGSLLIGGDGSQGKQCCVQIVKLF